jgi:hypothetical protein
MIYKTLDFKRNKIIVEFKYKIINLINNQLLTLITIIYY